MCASFLNILVYNSVYYGTLDGISGLVEPTLYLIPFSFHCRIPEERYGPNDGFFGNILCEYEEH